MTRLYRRVLLTNDDGIDAPGMAALLEAVAPLAEEVWVVAPEHDQSGQSRAVTLHQPLRFYERGERRFAVAGTPSDCAILALRRLMRETPPDMVFSGINRGANIAGEVAYSGTVAAAMAAKLCGVPAIAISQAWRDARHIRWGTSVSGLRAVLDAFGPVPACVLNVNVPDVASEDVTGIALTRQGPAGGMMPEAEMREDMRGHAYYWLHFHRSRQESIPQGSDVAALREGKISVTPLGGDLTDVAALDDLRQMMTARED
jgi:5'-nucleotidase